MTLMTALQIQPKALSPALVRRATGAVFLALAALACAPLAPQQAAAQHGGSEPIEPTGITHVIYLVGTTFFPDEVHAKLGDTLMFVNLTDRNQKVEADDHSWSSGTLGYKGTYPIMLDRDTDWSFTAETRTYYGWYTYTSQYSGRALTTPNDDETDPRVYPHIATSLAERFGVTEAVRRIETTRQHVYTVDTNGNVLNGGPGG